MRLVFVIPALFLAAAPAAAIAALPVETPAPYRAGEIIVKYRGLGAVAAGTARGGESTTGKAAATTLRQRAQSRMQEMGLRPRASLLDGRAELMTLPAPMDVPGALRALAADADVEYAEPNYLYFPLQDGPGDPLFDELWGLHNTGQNNFACNPGPGCPVSVAGADLNVLEAWRDGNGNFTRVGNSTVTVAIIDEAFDLDHPDLNFLDGFDFVGDDSNPRPDDSSQTHGTMVAGSLGAIGGNGRGVAGTTWHSNLMPLKIGASGQSGFGTGDIVSAIRYARDHDAHIINASFGGPSFSLTTRDLICGDDVSGGSLLDHGILFVTSAGNDDANLDFGRLGYPALYDCPNVVAVAATNRQDNISSFSMYGPLSVDVAAPGLQIVTTTIDGYVTGAQGGVGGTSFSSPYTAGIAALLRAHAGAGTPDWREIKARLIESGTAVGDASADRLVAGGRIDAAQALEMPARPSLTIDEVTIGNASNRLIPGESADIEVVLSNGWLGATGVTATLRTDSPLIDVQSGGVGMLGSDLIPQGGSTLATFNVEVSLAQGHHYVTFDLEITANGYAASRYFVLEVAELEHDGTMVAQRFQPDSSLDATLESSLYDEFHTWHVPISSADLLPDPDGPYTLFVRTRTPNDRDIDLLGRAGTPPRYLITLNADLDIPNARAWFCTDDSGDCREDPSDPTATRVSGRSDGHEMVTHVFDGSDTPEDFFFTVVNFAQAGFEYDIWAELRAGDLRPGPGSICPGTVELCSPDTNSFTVTGLSGGAETPVYIRRGEYRINGGDYTSNDGTVGNGDTIDVRAGGDAELTVGGITARFASGSAPGDPSSGGGSSSGGGGGGCALSGGGGRPDPLLPLLVLLAGLMTLLRLPLPLPM